MTQIVRNIENLRASLPEDVTLVAVSKTQPTEAILEAYNAGQRDFGENKIQEMLAKQAELPKDIRWHMIGHVQTNKVKLMAGFVHLVHGVDSERLLAEIDRQADQAGRTIDCLLQVFIASEVTKFGLDEGELSELLKNVANDRYPSVRVRGLMGMASFTQDGNQVQREFGYLKSLFDRHAAKHGLDTLSMGMSGDFQIAVRCGSTMVRVGSRIFGARNY